MTNRSSKSLPWLLSIAVHAGIVGVALVPWSSERITRPKLNKTEVVVYTPKDNPSTMQLPGRSGGGGGGGKHELTRASRGVLPRGADRQLAPPNPEQTKNLDPRLIVEPTIVAPQLTQLPQLTLLNLGDPNGVSGPPSSGTGDGGGIGDRGKGRGVGDSEGPGTGPGKGGGCCDGTFVVGGDVSAPTVIYRVEPEYSEEARRARYQGTVVLQAVIRRDGKVDTIHLVRTLGFGLDQNAIEALKQWRFHPAMKDGVPVDSTLNIEVRFNLR
jgi:periplasmic protein TonB